MFFIKELILLHNMSQFDKELKEELTAAYHIIAGLGMDDLTYTHISIRSSDRESFYIYPFGSLFEEVSPNNLIRVSLEGKVLEGSEYQYNKTGYITHTAIYNARNDLNALFHLHTIAGVTVSTMKFGLLPISQFALHLYDKISYHEYDSLPLVNVAGDTLAKAIGKNNVMILKNHGTFTCGKSIHEAMFYTYHLEQACKTQVKAIAAGIDNLNIIDADIAEKSRNDLLAFEKDLGKRDWIALKRKFYKP